MDTSTCTTLVLVLLWLSICCQALGSLVALIDEFSTTDVLSSTTTLSTVLLGLCLWQCKKAGYLVSPMTWYHWALLVLLVILQVLAVVMAVLKQVDPLQHQDEGSRDLTWAYSIYAVEAVLLVVLGSTLFCGWKCNLFCRPCCKSQFICYGSAIVVILVLLTVMAVIVSMGKHQPSHDIFNAFAWVNEVLSIRYLSNMVVPCTQGYIIALLWITILKLPYTVPEVVSLVASALTVASLLALAVPITMEIDTVLDSTLGDDSVLRNATAYSFLLVHLVALGFTWYCLEYKKVFYWPKNYMCFGVLGMTVILVAVVVIVIHSGHQHNEPVEYTLLGYSLILMVPTLWYAYRCGLLTWKWSFPKKKNLKAADSAESHDTTAADTDIAKES